MTHSNRRSRLDVETRSAFKEMIEEIDHNTNFTVEEEVFDKENIELYIEFAYDDLPEFQEFIKSPKGWTRWCAYCEGWIDGRKEN